MILRDLLEEVEGKVVGETEKEISDIIFDSRKVVSGCAFVALTGVKSDGHDYIAGALMSGATAIVAENEEKTEAAIEKYNAECKEIGKQPTEPTVIYVKEARKALALMSAAYFGHPEKKLTTIGITGTKGKTTTSYMVYSVLSRAGIPTGLIGTIETIIGEEKIPSTNTTPISYLMYSYFDRMVKAGCKCVVMEVSSQGLMQYRVGGVQFDYAVLTNIEPDHIGPGEHSSFEEYMACKGILFTQCKKAIVNVDDSHWKTVLQASGWSEKENENKSSFELIRYSAKEKADYYAKEVRLHAGDGGLAVAFSVDGRDQMDVRVNIPGMFTVYNSMTAVILCMQLGVEKKVIQEAILDAKVRGRVEPVKVSERFSVMVDYAHNAMSLKSLLTTLREYNPKRLVCLFGCGGNRSRDRRFEMGEISSEYADLTIITSDNPRFEEPEDIIADIVTGVKKKTGEYVTVQDRKEAIRYALEHAEEGDVILVAGKGHEDYQEIRGVKYPMDDRTMILESAKELGLIG